LSNQADVDENHLHMIGIENIPIKPILHVHSYFNEKLFSADNNNHSMHACIYRRSFFLCTFELLRVDFIVFLNIDYINNSIRMYAKGGEFYVIRW